MLAKLATIIVAIGLTACGLLAMRQARLQAAHELAQAQLRIARVDERLLTLHALIADEITPGRIRQMRLAALEAGGMPTPSSARAWDRLKDDSAHETNTRRLEATPPGGIEGSGQLEATPPDQLDPTDEPEGSP